MKYLALIRKEEGTDYWADAPDIPGCVSRGATIEEAMANFEDALKLHLENVTSLPPARSKEDALADEQDPWLRAFWVHADDKDSF